MSHFPALLRYIIIIIIIIHYYYCQALRFNIVKAYSIYLCLCQCTISLTYSRDDGRSSSAGIFVGGFVLGGIIVGALGCVAPQISKVLAGANRRELISRLPKFIYDEEKALERTRKLVSKKIHQLNSAIDEVSAQLRADDPPS